MSGANTSGAVTCRVGVGIDSTTVGSDQLFMGRLQVANHITTAIWCEYNGRLSEGYHSMAWLEAASALGTTTWYANTTPGVDQLLGGLKVKVWG